MNDEPPSISAESNGLGFRKKIKDRIKEIYQNFSYKPKNKQELAGSIRDSSERGVLEKGTLNMIEGALKVSTDQVRDVMIPRPQVVFIEKDEKPEDFLPRVIKSGHSRFPVLNTENDKIEGILLAKELLPFISAENISTFELDKLIRPAKLVPESKKLNILLDELKASRNHMAIVLDEYGDITGIVTIEDVLEEIVGEIEDLNLARVILIFYFGNIIYQIIMMHNLFLMEFNMVLMLVLILELNYHHSHVYHLSHCLKKCNWRSQSGWSEVLLMVTSLALSLKVTVRSPMYIIHRFLQLSRIEFCGLGVQFIIYPTPVTGLQSIH